MSNINKTFEITFANQDLFEDLNEKDSEKVRGGFWECLKFINDTEDVIRLKIDGIEHSLDPNGGKPVEIWAFLGGKMEFDQQPRTSKFEGSRGIDLKNGDEVTFKYLTRPEGYNKRKPVIRYDLK